MSPESKQPPNLYEAAAALLESIGIKPDDDKTGTIALALSLYWHDGFKANNKRPAKIGEPQTIECSCEGCKEYLYRKERREVQAIHSGNDIGHAAAVAVNEAVDAHAYVCRCGLVTLDLREDRVEDKRQEGGLADLDPGAFDWPAFMKKGMHDAGL